MAAASARRVLIVDDDPTVRSMMADILQNSASRATSTIKISRRKLLQEEPPKAADAIEYQVAAASCGMDALATVQDSLATNNPFLMCFLDMRMPPGWDGLETMTRIWEIDPHMQIALCSAYDDHSWKEIIEKALRPQNLLILKKPFDYSEIAQMALALSEKGLMARRSASRTQILKRLAKERAALLLEANRKIDSETGEKRKAQAENVELEAAINATVQTLLSLMELSSPGAFSHAKRVAANCALIASAMRLPDAWKHELAAMLLQLGSVTVPEGSLKRHFNGAFLSPEEAAMINGYPAISAELVAKIPKLESVAEMMRFREGLGDALRLDFSPASLGEAKTGAWILKTAVDFDILLSRHSKAEALSKLRESPSEYPERLIEILEHSSAPDEPPRIGSAVKVPLMELEKEMLLNEDIVSRDGYVVARRDQRLTQPLVKRIRNFVQAGLIEKGSAEIIGQA